MISPFFVQWIVDGAIVSGDKDLLTLLGLGFLLVLLLKTVVSAGRSWVVLALSTQLNVQWSARVMGHLIRLPMKYFATRHTGDIVSRFQSMNAIQQTLTGSLVEALLDGVFAALTLALMFVYSAKLAIVALIAISLYAVLRIASYAPLRRASGEYLAISAREQTHFLESLRGVQSVKLGGQEEKRRAKWLNLLVQATNRHVSTQKMTIGFSTAYALLFGIESLVTLYWGAQLAMDNLLSVGDAAGLHILQGLVLGPDERLYRQGDRSEDAKPSGRTPGRHRIDAQGKDRRQSAFGVGHGEPG